MDRQQTEKIRKISGRIMASAKNSLIVHLRFLDWAINKLSLVECEEYINVNGLSIGYNPIFVLQCYMQDKNWINRMYLHMVLHCTFLHFYVGRRVDRDLWDIACDITVENIVDQLAESEEYLAMEQSDDRKKVIDWVKENVGKITAEKVYRLLLDRKLTEEQAEKLYILFAQDDHSVWYENNTNQPMELQNDKKDKEQKPNMEGQSDNGDAPPEDNPQEDSFSQTPQDDADSEDSAQKDSAKQQEQRQGKEPQQQEASSGDDGQAMDKNMQQLMDEWEDVAKHMELDMETFSKEKGSRVGDLLLNIKNVTKERYDYTAFLKKFASMGEKMVIDDDEFDYIYYTYGLSLYNNMPLVEPLEYKETNVVKEFVIAIDTSFSVHGDEVQSFLRKTYNILKSTESFSTKLNLHIIQCDVKVQHDEKITFQAQLDQYMKDMLLYGFGGTDFRPVFEYVNQLIENKEFSNLKGLIYFTDGYGTFPERPPSYKTAFAFVSDDPMFDPVVPPWAIKLILDPEDIKEDKQ